MSSSEQQKNNKFIKKLQGKDFSNSPSAQEQHIVSSNLIQKQIDNNTKQKEGKKMYSHDLPLMGRYSQNQLIYYGIANEKNMIPMKNTFDFCNFQAQQFWYNQMGPAMVGNVDTYTNAVQLENQKLQRKTTSNEQNFHSEKNSDNGPKKQFQCFKKNESPTFEVNSECQLINNQEISEKESKKIFNRRDDQKLQEQRNVQNFTTKFSYYIKNNMIIYPIEDHLFERGWNFLQEENLTKKLKNNDASKPVFCYSLPAEFSGILEIWNMLKEHSSFFEVQPTITLKEVEIMMKGQNPQEFEKIFQKIHDLQMKDLLYEKLQDSVNESHFHFTSLFKYADEYGFINKIFKVFWFKLMLTVINQHKKTISNEDLMQDYCYFDEKLQNTNENVKSIAYPSTFKERINYLCFVLKTSYQTITFRNLISSKIQFFRDNNKAKNQLNDQRKVIDNQLWSLKERQKLIIKKEKSLLKTLKKQKKCFNQKNIRYIETQLVGISQIKVQISTKKEVLTSDIEKIQNSIYELTCMPQFSNIWLLGEDRHQHLYWYVNSQSDKIFVEVNDKEWSYILFEDIHTFICKLNLRGIRERKLFQKIDYYLKLGYLKPKTNTEEHWINEDKIQNQDQKQLMEERFSEIKLKSCSSDVNESFEFVQMTEISMKTTQQMILKSEQMMNKYLVERNSKWTCQENRLEYINKMNSEWFNMSRVNEITSQLRSFNEKICVVEINYKVEGSESKESKSRKIQTKLWGINEKFKHNWYDYSKQCQTMSDLSFLVSILYLTIQKYVTKLRKLNNTKYFYKSSDFSDQIPFIDPNLQSQDPEINTFPCILCEKNNYQIEKCQECKRAYHLDCFRQSDDSFCQECTMCLGKSNKKIKEEEFSEEKMFIQSEKYKKMALEELMDES